MKPLIGKRILICGKGGSGKSSIVTLMAQVLEKKGYPVILIDGDASNPVGLLRLVTGGTVRPLPLIEFFGGREMVLCPVDDPAPLTRIDGSRALIDEPIQIDEIPSCYYIRDNNLVFFQVGKIKKAYEGCDGPMSKITRDFIVEGDFITLIDVEAGVEHFGRGIEKNVDAVLIVVNPVFESLEVAKRVYELCTSMQIEYATVILNSIQDDDTEKMIRNNLTKNNIDILGSVRYSHKIFSSGLKGTAIGYCGAYEEMRNIIDTLEALYNHG